MQPTDPRASAPRIWQVGALCRAVADALDARFNPVAVRGEICAFSRAASGHCYFTLKDGQGQLRCAMFRRAASMLDFAPREGDLVEVRGRLDVYDPRGELQMVVESLSRAGQGTLFDQFLQRKARLEAQGLFDPARKRPIPPLPRGIGLVTSLGAAALHDVTTALRRRAPHVPVLLAPAPVQGSQAPAALVQALHELYRQAQNGEIDVILLVRGGGSLEDLWAFNDEQLAHTIVASPVPLVCGVGHETDFTIADFCADLRAPTPTAAAELAAAARDTWLAGLSAQQERLALATARRCDRASQQLDTVAARLGRPSARLSSQQQRLERQAQRLRYALQRRMQAALVALDRVQGRFSRGIDMRLHAAAHQLNQTQLRLDLLDPRLVLRRGYAVLMREDGQVVASTAQVHPGDALRARLADGEVDLHARAARPD